MRKPAKRAARPKAKGEGASPLKNEPTAFVIGGIRETLGLLDKEIHNAKSDVWTSSWPVFFSRYNGIADLAKKLDAHVQELARRASPGGSDQAGR